MQKNEVAHGSYRMYFKHKCRCPECKSYQRERVANNRRDRLESGRLNHGSRSAYDCGCRCDKCKEARSAAGGGRSPSDSRHNHKFVGEILPYGTCGACDDVWAGAR